MSLRQEPKSARRMWPFLSSRMLSGLMSLKEAQERRQKEEKLRKLHVLDTSWAQFIIVSFKLITKKEQRGKRVAPPSWELALHFIVSIHKCEFRGGTQISPPVSWRRRTPFIPFPLGFLKVRRKEGDAPNEHIPLQMNWRRPLGASGPACVLRYRRRRRPRAAGTNSSAFYRQEDFCLRNPPKTRSFVGFESIDFNFKDGEDFKTLNIMFQIKIIIIT